ncbi:Transcription elongation factor spt6 [Coemansia sp. RSA 1286]|nr:Transcription elongation factor spt6 [Coemansia sp. RSA 1286]
MSDIDGYGSDDRRGRDRSMLDDDESEAGSVSYDTHRKYSDDDEDEEDDEDDNDDELRRDGFVVDDDEVEENESDGEERRRRRKKKKKKRRHHAHTDRGSDDDLLDEEDLALVAENTNQAYEKASRFKRLKRGRGRQTVGDDDEDDELRAELDDLVGNDGVDERRRERERDFVADEDDDLGLFGNDEIDDRHGGRGRGRGRSMGGEYEDEYAGAGYGDGDDYDGEDTDRPRRRYDDEIEPARRARAMPETRINEFVDSLDNIDEDTWMELQDIFGDGEEYAFAMNGPQQEEAYRERTLAEVFEPAELEAKLMTQRDEDIRATDVPERMQLRAAGREFLRPLSDDEIEEETTWVVRQLHAWLSRHAAESWDSADGEEPFSQADFINERFLAAVLSVLKLLSQEFLEVPFIARHRREVFVTREGDAREGEEPATREWLTTGDLWRLYDYDQQFRGLLSLRRAAERLVDRLVSANSLSRDDEEYARDLLAGASSVEEISDVTDWVQSRYASVIQASAQTQKPESTQKRVARSVGAWEQAVSTGVDEFIRASGISARQIGDNLVSPASHIPAEGFETPDDAARKLVGEHFSAVDAAHRAGRKTVAQIMALDPQIRRFVRAYCAEHACVITRPTDRGLREITDEDHPAFAFKYLRHKPVVAFARSAQWLALQKAVSDGLLRVEFTLTAEAYFDPRNPSSDNDIFEADREKTAQVVVSQIEPHLRTDAVNDAAAAWDRLRCDAITTAVRDQILPLVWRETSQHLSTQAFDFVADACRRALEKRIDIQPPRTDDMEEGVCPRVAVVAGGGFDASSRGALRVVVVDENGILRKEFSADSMRADGYSGPGDGIEPLVEAIKQHSVDVIAVAGMNMQTRRLFEDVSSLVSTHGINAMVTYASDEVARLWCDSDAAREEFSAQRREERYCVAVARTLQDAPSAYASLGARVLSLSLHSAQSSVDQSALLAIVERAYVNVVNRVGVDINVVASHPHMQHVLPYVAGLGPRKAQGILSRIGAGENSLESRNELVFRHICTRTVFINCVSFLRVRPSTDVLDTTRIHPADYDLARKMALDALDIEEEDDDSATQRGRKRADAQSRYVSELMRRAPEKLDELDLAKYADELERLLKVHKLETLKFIKNELQHPDADPRPVFEPPSEAQVLHMLTGETLGETIKDDGTCVVAATIVRVQPRFAIARLDSGLEGFISIGNVSDKRIDEVSDELAPGKAVVALIKRIDLDKMSLDLSIRPSDVAQACSRNRQPVPEENSVDKYFDFDSEAAMRERAKVHQNKASARTRTIPHPLFKPLNAREAEHYLAARPRGDCVIRPSSRGVDHIAITWKVGDGLFQHIDVREDGKINDAALGTSFLIGESVYTDLDELVAFHIDPIVRKLDEVKRSPKFYDPEADPLYASEPVADALGPNDQSEDYKTRRLSLWDTRISRHLDTLAQSTGRGAYCISLSLSKPGSLMLAFKPTPTYRGIMKWTARVEPNEFRLGDRGRYPDINGLIIGFKTMQMNPSQHGLMSGRDSSRRDGHSSSHRDSASGRRDASGSGRWEDSYRDRGRDRDRERDRDHRDRDRDNRGHGGRDRGWDRPRHDGRNGGGGSGWDTGASSSNHHSSAAAASSGWDV